MGFVAIAEALEDLQGVFFGRLVHHDLLESSLQRGVLFDVLAVFIERGRADALDFTAAQCRLEHVRGVDGPFRTARTHQRV